MLHVPSHDPTTSRTSLSQTSFGGHVSQPAARVAAIKAELGLPESLVGALPIVGAANLTMGMELDESATLPTMVQKLEAALGLQPSAAAAATAAPAPAPAAPAAA